MKSSMWYKYFENKYKSGISHTFLFHFNVRDLMDNYRYIDKYLYDEFIKQRNFSIVAFYDISRGLRFMDAGMEREFNKITENKAEPYFNSLPSKIFPYIDMALKGTKTVLFIDHVDKLIPSGDIGSMSFEERSALIWISEWSVNPKISSVGSAIFMLSDNIEDVNREIPSPPTGLSLYLWSFRGKQKEKNI